MDIPLSIRESSLYIRLQDDPDLSVAILSLRAVAEKLADTVSRSLPDFTDHSVRHMDALWSVTDRILTSKEISALSSGEAFLLATGFYLHDIGMAYAATREGLARIRSSTSYTSFLAGLPKSSRNDPLAQARAVAFAIRKTHASAAIELARESVPGTEYYLFDSRLIREAWAETCGHIAASHHWSLETVEQQFGNAGTVPLPGNRKGDLGYVASILRLVDYAHINRDRAATIERAFRQPIERDSLIHWLAQEQVDGPVREGNDLVYRAARPLSDVDAWWLYYGMLTGLDAEIRLVRRYIDRRATSQGRLSLQSVRGAGSPQEAAIYIPTTGFLPIEVNLRTGSIEKLVQLLAGESLYGPDPMAAVRELIQNARDAVMLKAAVALTESEKAALSIPIKVIMRKEVDGHVLEVKDWGIGMTTKVMTDYLISIASDYWTSQFYEEFPDASERGFQPAGKFGIGFLSVFMLGDEVKVESNRSGSERSQLTLRGVGRRGELRTVPSPSGSGTTVQIHLKDSIVESLRPLPELARAYAPMLPHALEVDVEGQVTFIPKGWIFNLPSEEFRIWTLKAIQILFRNRGGRLQDENFHTRRYLRRETIGDTEDTWSGEWPEYTNPKTRLIACFDGVSLLCLRGLAIQPISTPGFVGVIDLESANPDVSRRQAINVNITEIMECAIRETRGKIVGHLNALAGRGLLINKLGFLDECISVYGLEVIRESSIPWISLIKMPGEVELLSSAKLLTKLTQSQSVFVVFDTGPWTAMKRWEEADPTPGPQELAIVLDATGRERPRYYSGSGEKTGSLADLWPNCQRASLFGTILRLAAEGWQVNLEELTRQNGWRQDGSTLWGRLTRP